MNGQKWFKVAGIILIALMLLLVLLLWVVDFGFLKPKIELAVSKATGSEFHIGGELHLKFLPTPTLLVENASLASPSWSDAPQMLTLGKAYLKINFISLLFSPIVVQKIEFENVHLLVEVGPNNTFNWNLANDKGQTKNEAPIIEEQKKGFLRELSINVNAAKIRNINVLFRQAESPDKLFTIESFNVKSDEGTSLIVGNAQFLDFPIAIIGKVFKNHADFDVSVGDVNISSQCDYSNGSVAFESLVTTLSQVGNWFGINNLPSEALALSGEISVKHNKFILKNIVASLSGLNVALNGQFKGSDASALISVEAAGNELSFLKPDLPALPFSLKADIHLASDMVDIKKFAMQFGESKADGTAHVKLTDGADIQLRAQSEFIDLSPFTAEKTQQDKTSTRSKKSNSGARHIFNDTPLPLNPLQSMTADIEINVKRIVLSEGDEIKDLNLNAQANTGTLNIKAAFNGGYGGSYDSEVVLTTSGNNADITLSAEINQMKFGLLSGKNIPEQDIPVTRLKVNLMGAGHSPRDLAASLNGRVVAIQGPGKVSNELIETFSGDIISQLFSAINPFAKEEKFTNWQCSLFAINFDSGLGEISGFLLQSQKLMVVGGGQIDLNDETLDIEFNTKPRTGVGMSADMFVTPFVKLSGTLVQPSVGLNAEGLLLNGGAAVLTGGLSFLYHGLFDRATAEIDRCQQTRDAILDHQTTGESILSEQVQMQEQKETVKKESTTTRKTLPQKLQKLH